MEGTTTPISAASDPRIMGCDSTQHASVFGAANQAGSFHITIGCSLDSFLDRAGKEHIRIVEQPLPDGLCGAWHEASRTIFLHAAQSAPAPLHIVPRAHTRQAPRPRMRQPIRNQMRAPLPQGDGVGVDIAGGLRHG